MLGTGTISNITVEELEGEAAAWQHLSDTEQAAGNALYDADTDTITFPNKTSAWNARMVYLSMENTQGKDLAVEFDLNITGGILTVYPSFEDAENFVGVGMEAGAKSSTLDGICYSNNTAIDNFYYREPAGQKNPNVVNGQVAKTNNRVRFEFYNGSGGTLAGGYVRFYSKPEGTTEFTLIGQYDFPTNYVDNPDKANRLAVQLVLGTGTISNITVEELEGEVAAWQHLSDTEQAAGNALYDADTDTITFPNKTSAWNARMVYLSMENTQGKDLAVEFDLNITGGILTVYPSFEDAENFVGVGMEAGAKSSTLDGICYSNNTAIDNFYYREPAGQKNPNVVNGQVAKTNNRVRFEFYNGSGGTLAGGYVRFYSKPEGTTEFTLIGQYDFPTNYVDNPDKANRLAVQLVLGTGTISNITVEEFTDPIAPGKGTYSVNWGYCTENDETIGSACFSDDTGIMTIDGSGAWDTRMISKQIADLTGKCFSLEFDCSVKTGGAIGFIPFYENESNWYGIYLDRGASTIDGAGFKDGKLIDDFGYKDDTLYPRIIAESAPVLNNRFRLRFEYYPNAQGGAAGATCRMYYRLNSSPSATDEWRRIGEFVLPETIADNPEVPNRLGIHSRLMKGLISNIVFEEIPADTQTAYYVKPDDVGSEDIYPDDTYIDFEEENEESISSPDESSQAVSNSDGFLQNEAEGDATGGKEVITKGQKITEYKSVPWWSIALIVCGGLFSVFTVLFIFMRKGSSAKKTAEKE